MTGDQILQLAKAHVGEKYILGTLVPKNDPGYKGPWDCAELTTWCVYQGTQKLYGCLSLNGNPATADAYTGYYKRDADTIGNIVPVEVAAKTPGAFVLRYSGSGVTGHVVISDGAGGTVEAHSHKDGVIKSVVSGRRWDIGILVPWVEYGFNKGPVSVKNPPTIIYRWTTPLMKFDKIKEIQKVLGITTDGIFGSKTFYALKNYQNAHNLLPDGEAGPITMATMGIKP